MLHKAATNSDLLALSRRLTKRPITAGGPFLGAQPPSVTDMEGDGIGNREPVWIAGCAAGIRELHRIRRHLGAVCTPARHQDREQRQQH